MGFPEGSDGKELLVTGDLGSVFGLGGSPGGGHGNPLQCFHLENPIDRGAWQATVHGVTKSQTGLIKQSTVQYRKRSNIHNIGFLKGEEEKCNAEKCLKK